jgi:hypothetical protein
MAVVAATGNPSLSLGTTAGTGSPTNSISDEFGGTQPHSLSEYYRDGSYSDGISIPSGETNIPASGEIRFSDFYGTSSGPAIGGGWPASQTSFLDRSNSPSPAAVTFTFNTNGTYSIEELDDGITFNDQYLTSTGTGNGTGFFIKFVSTNGNYTTNWGTENTYYELNSTRILEYRQTSFGTRTDTVTITIAEDSGGTGAVSTIFFPAAEVLV